MTRKDQSTGKQRLPPVGRNLCVCFSVASAPLHTHTRRCPSTLPFSLLCGWSHAPCFERNWPRPAWKERRSASLCRQSSAPQQHPPPTPPQPEPDLRMHTDTQRVRILIRTRCHLSFHPSYAYICMYVHTQILYTCTYLYIHMIYMCT